MENQDEIEFQKEQIITSNVFRAEISTLRQLIF
jgi:hypothetical protein